MTKHLFSDLADAHDALRAIEKAVPGLDQRYQELKASIKTVRDDRAAALLKQEAARAYISQNPRYHFGDVFRSRGCRDYVLTLVIEDVAGEQGIFGYLVSLGDDCGHPAGVRWSDRKGPLVTGSDTSIFSEGLTYDQFRKIAGRSPDNLELIGTTSTTASARGLKQLNVGIINK